MSKWWRWQWDETKKFFDLSDATRRSPPFVVKVGLGVFGFGFLLLVLLCTGVL